VERREDYVVVDGGRSGAYDESSLVVGEGELSSTFLKIAFALCSSFLGAASFWEGRDG